jgi:hypothetical protein
LKYFHKLLFGQPMWRRVKFHHIDLKGLSEKGPMSSLGKDLWARFTYTARLRYFYLLKPHEIAMPPKLFIQ